MKPEKHREYLKQYNEDNLEKKMLYRAKKRAKLKNLEFNIDESDIIPKFCPILGIELKVANKGEGKGGRHYSPSLDRIDSSKGYIKGNVWVISNRANTIKSDASKEELIKFAEWVKVEYSNSDSLDIKRVSQGGSLYTV